MSRTPSVEINKSQNDEFKSPCIQCMGETTHKILASVEVSHEEMSVYGPFGWYDDYQIIECAGCQSKSFRNARRNSEDYYHIGEDEWEREYDVLVKLYPSRIAGRKGIEIEDIHLPIKVRGIYKETNQALNNNSPILAGIGLRALIETICKEKNATGKTLYAKIDDLVEQKIITPSGSNILHKIRTLGNDAAHEVKPHTEKQLALAMDIVEHVLNDIYILPRKVKSEFGA